MIVKCIWTFFSELNYVKLHNHIYSQVERRKKERSFEPFVTIYADLYFSFFFNKFGIDLITIFIEPYRNRLNVNISNLLHTI